MLRWLKQLFGSKQCAVCQKKIRQGRPYYNDKGEPIVVCPVCVEYAERRAYRKR